MASIKNNLMDLALKQKLIGSSIYYIDNNGDGDFETSKVVKDFNYDSMTHTFTITFTDGDIIEFSDKMKYMVDIPDDSIIIPKPNKKRRKRKK